MQVEQRVWTATRGWQGDASLGEEAQLVLWFGGPGALASLDVQGDLSAAYPNALIAGCSTGGEIAGDEVLDDSVVSVACRFEKVALAHAEATIAGPEQSEAVGEALGTGLPATVDGKGLKGTFVLADGTLTNGSALIKGFRDKIGEEVTLTGGLAGDGPNFQKTLVGCNAAPRQGGVVAIGFYGDAFRLGWGSFGGWETFGPERSVTKSKDNVLFELDGEPALGLYKRYLGEEAKGLPGSALLFPLTIRPADDAKATLVRTIVGVDEGSQSMTFAGDIPQGAVAQLMRGHFDGLVDGAHQAAEAAAPTEGEGQVLALLVSCIGRKLMMGQHIVDEVEAAADALGERTVAAGFYSYGEIAPHGFTGRCELHNQTMTITTIGEA